MSQEAPQVKRFQVEEDLVLSYNRKGWVLIGNDSEFIASDIINSNIRVPYKDGKTMLEVIEEVIAKDLGEPLG